MPNFENDAQIVDAIKSAASTQEGKSATALAKSIGYSKSNDRVKRVIESMVDAGTLMAATSDLGYELYSLVAASSGGVRAAEAACNVSTPAQSAPTPGYTLPSKSYGYSVSTATDGRFAYNINMPDGKELQLTKSERLFVINQDANYRFIVEDPEDIMTAIGTFTQEAGYAHFLVKDLASEKHIKSAADLGTDVVLFVSIERHNKAGK